MTTTSKHLATMGTKSQYANNVLTPNADVDTWLKESHLDFTIDSSPLLFNGNDGSTITHEAKQVLYHSQTNEPLGVVGTNYNVVQPREVIEFYSELAERNGCDLQAAGFVRNGAGIYAMADTGRNFRIKGQDDIRGYLSFFTATDGTAATTIKLTSIRMVCSNQLTAIRSEDAGSIVRVKHSSQVNWERLFDNISYMLENKWTEFHENVEQLSDRIVTRKEVVQFYVDLFGIKDLDKSKKIGRLMNLYDNAVGQNLRSANDTAFGLVNSITYMADHVGTGNANYRLYSANYGANERVKNKAFDLAMKLAA